MEWSTIPAFVIACLTLVALVVGAFFVARATLSQKRTTEAEALATTRGAKIEDLEKEVGSLRERIATMEGQMTAIMSLKAEEIAAHVAAKVVTAIRGEEG